MKQAEIKTKLTADGSELSRALRQGAAQGADFAASMRNVGKAIGAAFTVQAIVSGIRAIAGAQVEYVRGLQDMRKESDAFAKVMENLWERLGNADSLKAVNKSLLEFRQSIRDAETEYFNMFANENMTGFAGLIEDAQDFFSIMVNGADLDEKRLNQLKRQSDELKRQYQIAMDTAAAKRAEIQAQERGQLERFDRARQTLTPDQMQAELSRLANEEINLRVAFELDPNSENRSAVEQSIREQERLNGLLKQAGDEATRTQKEMLDASLQWTLALSDQENFMQGIGRTPRQDRFSDLRRIGASEFGTGTTANKALDESQKSRAALEKLVMLIPQLPPNIASAIGTIRGIF